MVQSGLGYTVCAGVCAVKRVAGYFSPLDNTHPVFNRIIALCFFLPNRVIFAYFSDM